jgi:hypothetical protein
MGGTVYIGREWEVKIEDVKLDNWNGIRLWEKMYNDGGGGEYF